MRVGIITKSDIRNVDEGMETLGPSYLTGGNAEWCSCFGEILQFLRKLNAESPFDPGIALLGGTQED